MISKEQYLQAKKTIADYELQEWLFGNSGLLIDPAREDPKSPLQDAMDRGYRKGAVVNAYGERYKILFDPVISGKMVMAAVQGSKDAFKFDMPIWMEGVGYLFELETEAPESPVNNK